MSNTEIPEIPELLTSIGEKQNEETFMIKFLSILRETRGATAIEYGLIAALIAIAAISAMSSLGNQLKTTFTKARTEMAKT